MKMDNLVLDCIDCLGKNYLNCYTAETLEMTRQTTLRVLVELKQKLMTLVHQNSKVFGKQVFGKIEQLDVQMVDFMNK